MNVLVLSRLKTGNVPPHDLPFEEIPCKTGAKFGTLGRKKSKLMLNKLPEPNLFLIKREIEHRIDLIEFDIDKGTYIFLTEISIKNYPIVFLQVTKKSKLSK